jgi:hypothetical protein
MGGEPHITSPDASGTAVRRPAFGHRPGLYALVVLGAVLAASMYSLRTSGIFGCQANGYGVDRYLAYCNTKHYGDYDHGAFWFGLELPAVDAATNAEVLFLGNSRMEFGFSTTATQDWFVSLPARYYLLGFSHNANSAFEEPLLRKLHPNAITYVLNIDLFFEPAETQPARTVMHDANAATRYGEKRGWQHLHRLLCGNVPQLCGDAIAFYRSPATGQWIVTGRGFHGGAVSYDETADPAVVAAYTRSGARFLETLGLPRKCTILTIVPSANTPMGTARAIAAALNLDFVAPELTGLGTFDESHLDKPSAERWSAAFMDEAGATIRKCLNEGRDARAAVPARG